MVPVPTFCASSFDPLNNLDIAPIPLPLFIEAVPTTNINNYSAFASSFLTKSEIEDQWNGIPIIINESNSTVGPETEFLDAIGRVCANPHFLQYIERGSVIDLFHLNTSTIKYFATYSHIMDKTSAYIRLVAYNVQGLRCPGTHPHFGNRILVVPRNCNDVRFPSDLRYHALEATENCCYPQESHTRIRDGAFNEDMSRGEKEWWQAGVCETCHGKED